MNIVRFGFLIQLLIPGIAISQTLSVQEVSFTGSSYVSVREDSALTAFTIPQWIQSTSNPVAIVSGNALEVSAIFSSIGSVPPFVLISAVTTDNYQLPALSVSTVNPNNVAYPLTSALSTFPYHKIKYYNPFSIMWNVSFDNGITWQSAGTSDIKLYVMYQQPISESSFLHQHSLFEISCSNADSDSLENDIINHIWNDFTDRIIIDVKGDTLGYYSGDVWNAPFYDLIKDNFGICDQWAAFFLDLLKIQGLNYPNSFDLLTPHITNPTVCGDPAWAPAVFLINNHQVNTPSGNPFTCPLFPYLNVFDQTSFSYPYAEITDLPGTPGQNNSNPPPLFGSHAVVVINGVYYDPSYGNSYLSLNDFKLSSLTAFGISIVSLLTEAQLGIDIDQNSVMDTVVLYGALKITTDLSLGYFSEFKSTYGDLPTGLSEELCSSERPFQRLIVFPNPVHTLLTVRRLHIKKDNSIIDIFDNAGRRIYTQVFPSNFHELQVNIKDFEAGVYFIKVGDEVNRFVKQ